MSWNNQVILVSLNHCAKTRRVGHRPSTTDHHLYRSQLARYVYQSAYQVPRYANWMTINYGHLFEDFYCVYKSIRDINTDERTEILG